MNIPALLIGLGAAVLLLLAGYLVGLWRGSRERARLRGLTEQQAAILQNWKSAMDDGGALKSTIEQVLTPLVERERLSIEQVLAPLVERERLSLDLARVGGGGERRDLSPLLEQVASVGNFGSVLLSNEDGLVVAAAGTAPDFDAMAAATIRLTDAADQFTARRGGARAIVIRDATDSTTLCRLFTTQGQKMALTATSNDTRLAAVALDPALAKIEFGADGAGGRRGVEDPAGVGFFLSARAIPRRGTRQKKHGLQGDEVVQEGRHLRAERMAVGRERERALHLRADHVAQLPKVLDRAEVNVRRFVPRLGQIPCHRHAAVGEDLPADAPMPEIRKRHDHVARDA